MFSQEQSHGLHGSLPFHCSRTQALCGDFEEDHLAGYIYLYIFYLLFFTVNKFTIFSQKSPVFGSGSYLHPDPIGCFREYLAVSILSKDNCHVD